jgi:hypothetical protein
MMAGAGLTGVVVLSRTHRVAVGSSAGAMVAVFVPEVWATK